MNKIVGIQFREKGKIYHFDPGHFVLKKGDRVLVETEQGLAYGMVCTKPRNCNGNVSGRALKKILRLASDKDTVRYEKNCNNNWNYARYFNSFNFHCSRFRRNG